jgi:hypothetical protein
MNRPQQHDPQYQPVPSNGKVRLRHKPSNTIRQIKLAKSTARSRVTNGRELLPNIDGRSLWLRRYRDLLALHLSDLGGSEAVSSAELAILRRAACLMVELERIEVLLASDDPRISREHTLDVYQRGSNTLRRLLESVGLQRRQRDVTPTLDQYLDEHYPKREAAE